jgi:hypothetical protein
MLTADLRENQGRARYIVPLQTASQFIEDVERRGRARANEFAKPFALTKAVFGCRELDISGTG